MRFALPFSLCGLVAAASAQGLPRLGLRAGFQEETLVREHSSPLALQGFATGLRGEVLVAISGTVLSIDHGGRRRVLHALPRGHSVGILRRLPGSTVLWFTDFEASTLFGIDLFTGRRMQAPLPRNAFGLTLGPRGEVLVSANPNFPRQGARTGVWHVDVTRGRSREVVQLRGPSGPLWFDDRLGLLYAEQSSIFPAPPRSVRIWAFSARDLRAALDGGPPLTLARARLVLFGLDGAYDLAVDARGRLYVTDPHHGGILRARTPIPSSSYGLESPPLVARGRGVTRLPTLEMAFVNEGDATFDGYQPARGGALHVRVADFLTASEIRRLRPRRPDLVSSPTTVVPPGPLALLVRGAPPRARGWLCLSLAPPLGRERSGVVLPGGPPLWVGLAPAPPPLCVPLVVDARGAAQLRTVHPGGVAARLSVQAVLVDSAATPPIAASTNVHSLLLQSR